MLKTKQITVGTTRVKLNFPDTRRSNIEQVESNLIVSPIATGQTIYVGGPDVTTANGFPVRLDGLVPSWPLLWNEEIHAIAGSSVAVAVAQTWV